MTGYFVTDDERGRVLLRGDPDGRAELLAIRGNPWSHEVTPLMFDAAAAVLAPDDALIERVARAMFLAEYGDEADPVDKEPWRHQARAALAAVREEAGHGQP